MKGPALRRDIEVPATEKVEVHRWGKILRIEPVHGSRDAIVETDRPSPALTNCRAWASADSAGDELRSGQAMLRGDDTGTWVARPPSSWVVGDWVWVD